MDSCVSGNYINAKKRIYSGENSKNSAKNNLHKGTALSKLNTESGVVRTQLKNDTVRNRAMLPEVTETYTYVEHCGVKRTFFDAFHTERIHKKEKSCFDKIVMIILFGVLLFFMAGSYCEYLDAFNDVKSMETQIAKCKEEQIKYLMAIEERDSLAEIEKYAIENLGMVKSEKLTRHFVNISGEDVVTINDTETQGLAAQGVLLSGFKNIVSNLAD